MSLTSSSSTDSPVQIISSGEYDEEDGDDDDEDGDDGDEDEDDGDEDVSILGEQNKKY